MVKLNIAISKTFKLSHIAGSENQDSSITVCGVRGFPVCITAAIEDVKTTLLTDGTFAHDLRTLSVPFTAASTISA